MISDAESIALGALLPLPVEIWMRGRDRTEEERPKWSVGGWIALGAWLCAFSLRVGWSKGLAEYVIAVVLGITVPLYIQLWDRERMSPEERSRVWSLATWGPCLLYLGMLTLLSWSWVTRRSLARYLWGPLWLGIALGVINTLGIGLTVAFGDKLDGWYEGYLQAVAAIPTGIAILLLVSGITLAWRGLMSLVARDAAPSPRQRPAA